MPRPAAAIATEIAAIEAELPIALKAQSASDIRGVMIAKQRYADLTARLDLLYKQQDNGGSGFVAAPAEFVQG